MAKTGSETGTKRGLEPVLMACSPVVIKKSHIQVNAGLTNDSIVTSLNLYLKNRILTN